MDEVRFQQHGSRCRMWVPPDITDPVLMHHPTRKGIGYFGAVRLRDGRFLAVGETESFNAQSTWRFLRRLLQASCRSGRQVIVIADNARFHHASLHAQWRSQHEPDFQLMFLPPYSPDLNPIERVWKLVRRSCLHNRYFPTVESICGSVNGLFQTWANGSRALIKLCSLA